MTLVAGGLTHSPNNDRLFYVGVDGFIYYYSITSDWTFTYNVVPTTVFTNQNIRVVPEKLSIFNNNIFYIGKEITNNNALRIHEIIDNNGAWITNSPSWAAQANNQPVSSQVQSNGIEISVDQTGTRVFYTGIDNKIYFYEKLTNNNSIYSYNKTFGSYDVMVSNSLLPSPDQTIYYISNTLNNGDGKVHFVKLQESNCQNSAIQTIEPTFIYNRVSQNANYNQTDFAFSKLNKLEFKVYPSPTSHFLNITPLNSTNDTYSYKILSINGSIILQGILRNKKINCRDLNNGMYILTLTNMQTNASHYVKIIIQH